MVELAERADESRIIIVEVEERMVGLTVDSVAEVIRVSNNQIQEAPTQVAGEQTKQKRLKEKKQLQTDI